MSLRFGSRTCPRTAETADNWLSVCRDQHSLDLAVCCLVVLTDRWKLYLCVDWFIGTLVTWVHWTHIKTDEIVFTLVRRKFEGLANRNHYWRSLEMFLKYRRVQVCAMLLVILLLDPVPIFVFGTSVYFPLDDLFHSHSCYFHLLFKFRY